ncbi:MAG: peptide chain release factor N(5)-glutamine methyltransferase [Candidatus Binatia bacterium]
MMGGEFQIAKICDPEPVTVRQALQEGTGFLSRMGLESARLEAELLLGKVLGGGREGLYLNYEMPLKRREKNLFQRALQRRTRREPVSYITGQREFWSLEFLVTPAVLVPRPETELLVEVALEVTGQSDESFPFKILDLGTGSGAIAVSLAKERGDLEVWATDLSSGALEIARANAAHHGVGEKVHFLQGDLFEPVDGRQGFFHLVVSNPPYVRRGEFQNLPPEIRDWEPRSALDGGVDGLDLYRRIIQEGHLYMVDGGLMALEIGADMGDEISRLFASVGFYSEGTLHRDCAGRDRVVVARKLP